MSAGAWTKPWGWTEAPIGETAMRKGETWAACGWTFVLAGAGFGGRRREGKKEEEKGEVEEA
jgi:hypothetical protein